MKNFVLFFILLFSTQCYSQSKKTELFDLIKKFIPDSSDISDVGDWSVGKPSAFPVKWDADRVEMSDDLKINFFRKGSANISANANTYPDVKWSIMLKGARSGYSSFTIASGDHKNIKAKTPIDSLFGKRLYTYKLLKDCSNNPASGFYYYQLKIPKKNMAWIRVAWKCNQDRCNLTIDGYDDWSKQYAELACPK